MGVSIERSRAIRLPALLSGFLVLPCFGIAFLRLFAFSMPSYGTGESFWFFLQPLTIVILVIFERKFAYRQQDVVVLVAAAACCMALGGIISTAPSLPELLKVAAMPLRFVCSGVLILGMGYYLCSIPLRFAVLSITAAFLIYGVAAQITLPLLGSSNAFLSAVFALCSGLCIASGINRTVPLSREDEAFSKSTLKNLPWTTGLIIPISALYLFRESFPAKVQSQTYVAFLWIALYAGFLAATLVWMLVLRRRDPDKLLPAFIVSLIVAPLCYALFSPYAEGLSESLLQSAAKCYLLVVWIYLVSAVDQTKLPAVTLFGLGHLILAQAPRMVRQAIAPFVADVPLDTISFVGTLLLFAAAAAICIVLALRVRVILRQYNRLASMGQEDFSGSSQVVIAAQRFSFSMRETEVAQLLTRGYSFAQIGEKLFISTETVRTHCKNLYRKAGVRNKKELIALMEDMQ